MLDDLKSHLGPDTQITLANGAYAQEPRGRFVSENGIVVAPRDVAGVQAALRYASDTGTPVVPYGGGTGLVGGQIARSDHPHIVLSLHRMAAIDPVDVDGSTLTVQAGAILADVRAAADDAGLLFPLSLASQGSARMGGLLATNAGGVNVLRYGNARDLCLGLQVVWADGTVWNGLSGLRKDNTGYDLKNLVIGSEGSLGVITAATVRLFPQPRAFGTALFQIPDPAAALPLLTQARSIFGETISAFELISRQGLMFLAETLPDVRLPLGTDPAWMVLMDIGGADQQVIDDQLMTCFEQAMADDIVMDGALAQSHQDRMDFWAVRENLPTANRAIGSVSSHDISVPVGSIPAFITRTTAALAQIGPYRINCFGHVGDGNLHYNVFPDPGKTRADYADQRLQIKQTVHDIVHDFGGSVSAEHGVGRLKVDDLRRYSDPTKLKMMAGIKQALDPKGILNPGVIVPAKAPLAP
ncbi:MAG: FAD-binding oxidoreductase [Pseudomonadota bacterium]